MSHASLVPVHPPSGPAPSPDTARAVEVVATFGDSVVGVRHVSDPRGGVVRSVTKALLLGGAALLATSAVAFGYATHVAQQNEDALARWKARGKPAWAFRPQLVPRSLDGLMIGGSVLGLAAIGWGLSRRRDEQQPAHVRLGAAAGVDFPVEGVGARFDLVAPHGDGFVVNVAPGVDGELRTDAGSVSLATLAGRALPVTPDTRIRMKLGASTFNITSVPAARNTATGALTFDRRAATFVAGSAVAHLGLVALLSTVAPALESTASNAESFEIATLGGEAHAKEDPTLDPQAETDPGDSGETSGEAARMALESGTMGSDNPIAADSHRKRRVASEGDPSVAKSEALRRAIDSGILGSDLMRGGDRFSSVTGRSDLTSGFDDLDLDGAWDGNGDGVPGGFGNGPGGWGPGGGGNDWNSVWAGNWKTISDGRAAGDTYLPGGKGGNLRRHVNRVPTVDTGVPKCTGSVECDPSIVKRYLKRHASKFAYCYEKELLAHPGLAGTVATQFTVMPNGTVMSPSATGVSENVSSCVAGVISNIKFPKFAEAFQVKYPIHVRPAGS
jgi:hypothetical protein